MACAISYGKAEFIEQVAVDEDITKQSDRRPSPLRMAASHETKEHSLVVRKLLAMKASVNLPDSTGITPLLAIPMQEKLNFAHPDRLGLFVKIILIMV